MDFSTINWLAVLVAGISSFHARKFFPRGNRRPLSLARIVCLNQLVQTAVDCHLVPSGAIVALDDFNSLAYGERCYLSGGLVEELGPEHSSRRAKPYFVAFHHCLAHAVKLARPGKKVQFVFAQQKEFRPRL